MCYVEKWICETAQQLGFAGMSEWPMAAGVLVLGTYTIINSISDSASQGMPEPWDVLGSYAASRLLSEYRLTGNFQKPIR